MIHPHLASGAQCPALSSSPDSPDSDTLLRCVPSAGHAGDHEDCFGRTDGPWEAPAAVLELVAEPATIDGEPA